MHDINKPDSTDQESFADAEPLDPFDTKRLRTVGLAEIGVDRYTLSIPVRRPGRAEFFRVHPDPEYCVDWYVLEYEHDQDREVYWVTERFHAGLMDELRPVRILVCINKFGNVFLWPAKLPTDTSSSGRRWAASALAVAEHAKTHWVKLVGNRNAGAYDMLKARGDLGEPAWPDKSLDELLRVGFQDHLIDALDHPVLRELNGEL